MSAEPNRHRQQFWMQETDHKQQVTALETEKQKTKKKRQALTCRHEQKKRAMRAARTRGFVNDQQQGRRWTM
jgi:hypothetical protein